MRKLSGGDIDARLARIDKARHRSRRWRRNARAKLLRDQGAQPKVGVSGVVGYIFDDGERGAVCSKHRYWSRADAEHALAVTQASDDPWRNETRVYACRYCRGHHLTSKEYRPHGYQENQHQHQQIPREQTSYPVVAIVSVGNGGIDQRILEALNGKRAFLHRGWDDRGQLFSAQR